MTIYAATLRKNLAVALPTEVLDEAGFHFGMMLHVEVLAYQEVLIRAGPTFHGESTTHPELEDVPEPGTPAGPHEETQG